MQNPSCSDRRAFTLVELLTVIAIIAILAAILFPSLGKIRQNAATTKCVANLRTWGTATNLHVAENKGRLPVSHYVQGATINGTYFSFIAQDAYLYLNRYVLSPADPSSTWGYNQAALANFTCTTRTEAGNNLTWAAYGFNHYASALTLTAIPEPARLVWATEAAGGSGGQRWITPTMLSPGSVNLGGAPVKPHGTKHNILYLDGHVVTRDLREIVKADFTRGTSSYNAADDTLRIAN